MSKLLDLCVISTLVISLVLVINVKSQPILMTEDIGELIFQKNKYYLIYVYEKPSEPILAMFNEYCIGKDTCAILNKTVEEYDSVTQFIGNRVTEFFLILNVPFQKKYILDLEENLLTKNDLVNFEKRFQAGTLQPFHASEDAPKQNSQTCRQLVGSTFNDFIQEPAIIKVIYTYTKHEACEGCLVLLKDYFKLAKSMHNEKVLNFGFIDIYHNDLLSIPSPMVPHFYIYQGKQMIKQVDEADFEDLSKIIKKEVGLLINKIAREFDSESIGGDSSSSDISESRESYSNESL